MNILLATVFIFGAVTSLTPAPELAPQPITVSSEAPLAEVPQAEVPQTKLPPESSAIPTAVNPTIEPFGKTWEMSLGYQRWIDEGFFTLGYRRKNHEIRLLGNPSLATGQSLGVDYRGSFVTFNKMSLTAGGLVGYPLRTGAHLGALYRTGGDSFFGRLSLGVDGGAMCGWFPRGNDCRPFGGLSASLHFSGEDFP